MARTATKPTPTPAADVAALGLAPLTEDDIARQTDEGSFKRGRGYANNQRIFRAVRRDNVLRARCYGSSGGPYLVEATLATSDKSRRRNPVSYSCDCPRGGFCKHVVALLLTWIRDPEAFAVRPPLAEQLASKSRDELVAIVAMLLKENPDFEDLLDLPIVIAGSLSDAPVDEAAIRRQVAAAFRDDHGFTRGGWHNGMYVATRMANKLERILVTAEAYAEAGDWSNAVRVLATFVDELAPHYQPFYDQEGDLSSLLSRADELLASSLETQNELPADKRLSPDERQRAIDAILTIWRADIEAGGLDFSDRGPEAIPHVATAEEQERVGAWLRHWMQGPGAAGDNWWRQAAIRFLSELAGEAGLSDDELLTEYRNAELWDEAAALLLERGRLDEAIALARRHLLAPMLLLPFADQLIATKDRQRIGAAIALVDDRLWEHEGENIREDQALREWLERRYAEHGQPEKALALARGRFKKTPNKATYDAIKTACLSSGQTAEEWPAVRQELIATLRKKGEWYALIDIFLEDGDIGEALGATDKAQKGMRATWSYGWGISPDTYIARVAAAAEQEFPDESMRLYRQLADRRIDERNRSSYRYAAGYLANVWRVLESHGRTEEWPPLIGDVRERNRSLRALREELDALGLR